MARDIKEDKMGFMKKTRVNRVCIDAFRGLNGAVFDNLGRINYIVGRNNSGKTSFLEAFVAGGCFADVELLIDTVFARSQKRFLEEAKNMLAPRGRDSSNISVIFSDDTKLDTEISLVENEKILQDEKGIQNKKRLTIHINSVFDDLKETRNEKFWIDFEYNGKKTVVRKDPNISKSNWLSIPCQFVAFSRFDRIDKILQVLDGVFLNNKRDQLIEALRIFDPQVSNFEVIGEERQILIFQSSNSDTEPLFLNDYGNGMYKAFYIACTALQMENGILLIDELEAGIHHEALQHFLLYLEKLSIKNNIQLFITTHSLELLDVARRVHAYDDLAVYHIKVRSDSNKTTVVRLGKEELSMLRGNLGVDIR